VNCWNFFDLLLLIKSQFGGLTEIQKAREKTLTGDLSQPEISRSDVLSVYAYNAKLLLLACS
jgi:hypothetical protein